MKFGIFLPNATNGYILSSGSPQYAPSYAHNKAITLEAERQGLDYVLSMIKFRGFGGETGYWNSCLESFTLMAALAADTTRIELFPSVGLQSLHPAVVARMVATIDDISGGRCGLNIVTGWNKPEYEQMGLWLGDEYYDKRYEYATEYVRIVQALWRDGEVTHDSEFFHLKDCRCLPKPRREIPVVCAGQSPRGLRFTAEMGRYNFVMSTTPGLKTITRELKTIACPLGRQVGTLALFTLIAAETDAEAADITAAIMAGADHEAIGNVLASASRDSNPGGTSAALQAALASPVEDGNIVFMGFPVIQGSFRNVAAQLDAIARDSDIDGILFNLPDFVPGIRDFGERVMPLLACRAGATAR